MRPKAALMRDEAEPACAAPRRRRRGFDDPGGGHEKPPGVSFESRAAEWSRRESNRSEIQLRLAKRAPGTRSEGRRFERP
jgi:hypothetical protein